MNIGNDKSHKIDLIQHLVLVYYLSKSLHYEAKFVKEYLNKDYKRRLGDASAALNYFCKGIEDIIPSKEMDAIEEIIMQVLEKVNEVDFNQKVAV